MPTFGILFGKHWQSDSAKTSSFSVGAVHRVTLHRDQFTDVPPSNE